MIKIVILILILILISSVIILFYNKKRKLNNLNFTNNIVESKSTIINLPKLNTTSNINNNIEELSFDVFSIVNRDGKFDFMLIFENNSSSHSRIELKEINLKLSKTNKIIYGDFHLDELSMGTNDVILKNTILIGGNLTRNVYFENFNLKDFFGDDSITIKLLNNGEQLQLSKSIADCTVDYIEVFN